MLGVGSGGAAGSSSGGAAGPGSGGTGGRPLLPPSGGAAGSGGGGGGSGGARAPLPLRRRRRRSAERDSDTEDDLCEPPARRAAHALTCLTYNVDGVERHLRAGQCAASSWAQRWGALAAALLRAVQARDVDVLCLQEVPDAGTQAGCAFRAALAAGGLTLAAQAHSPLVVVPAANRGAQGDDNEAATRPALADCRWVQLYLRERPGRLELVPRAVGGKEVPWERVSQREHGVAGGSVLAKALFAGRFPVVVAGVHFSWGGERTLFGAGTALDLAGSVPRNHGAREAWQEAISGAGSARGGLVAGSTMRAQQSRALAYAVERVAREFGLGADPRGWLAPAIVLGDTNWRADAGSAVGEDEARWLEGPPWRECAGAELRGTYPFKAGEAYLPRYDRVLVRSLAGFYALPEALLRRRLAEGGAQSLGDARAALGEARPVSLAVLKMLGGEGSAPALRGKCLSDHWGVAVRVEFE